MFRVLLFKILNVLQHWELETIKCGKIELPWVYFKGHNIPSTGFFRGIFRTHKDEKHAVPT